MSEPLSRFDILPNDIMFKILVYLDYKDQLTIQSSCKKIYNTFYSPKADKSYSIRPYMYKYLCERDLSPGFRFSTLSECETTYLKAMAKLPSYVHKYHTHEHNHEYKQLHNRIDYCCENGYLLLAKNSILEAIAVGQFDNIKLHTDILKRDYLGIYKYIKSLGLKLYQYESMTLATELQICAEYDSINIFKYIYETDTVRIDDDRKIKLIDECFVSKCEVPKYLLGHLTVNDHNRQSLISMIVENNSKDKDQRNTYITISIDKIFKLRNDEYRILLVHALNYGILPIVKYIFSRGYYTDQPLTYICGYNKQYTTRFSCKMSTLKYLMTLKDDPEYPTPDR